jgi:hypothetical protein
LATLEVDALDPLIAAAKERVGSLEQHRDALPRMLAAAATQLVEVEQAVAAGASAFARARDRISSPIGLVQPLDLAGQGDRALRPWLARIQERADADDWETAYKGLTSWQSVADAWLANARSVVTANAAPVRRRNELRGLLDAYRAKAVVRGRAEDEGLALLHTAARDALFIAPCSLKEAERRVRDYVEAVNAVATGSQR